MTTEVDLSGIWHSKYRYPSTSRHDMFEDEHFVRIVWDEALQAYRCHSLPNEGKSQLEMTLSVEGRVVTGIWREVTAKDGYYKGRTYHGALQLVLDEERHYMSGKWVGVGSRMVVNIGTWELTFVSGSLPAEADGRTASDAPGATRSGQQA